MKRSIVVRDKKGVNDASLSCVRHWVFDAGAGESVRDVRGSEYTTAIFNPNSDPSMPVFDAAHDPWATANRLTFPAAPTDGWYFGDNITEAEATGNHAGAPLGSKNKTILAFVKFKLPATLVAQNSKLFSCMNTSTLTGWNIRLRTGTPTKIRVNAVSSGKTGYFGVDRSINEGTDTTYCVAIHYGDDARDGTVQEIVNSGAMTSVSSADLNTHWDNPVSDAIALTVGNEPWRFSTPTTPLGESVEIVVTAVYYVDGKIQNLPQINSFLTADPTRPLPHNLVIAR